MGATRDDFIKYPRTPHLFGARGTPDDNHLSQADSLALIADPSLIVEEKLDGTNVGIHFTTAGRMVLQCRGHEVTAGLHPQYDLFKQWVNGIRPRLETLLNTRYILFGEWLYAHHTVRYDALSHYFFEFDIYDKLEERYLDLATRFVMLDETGIHTVPVLHQGALTEPELRQLLGPSRFASTFDNPLTGRPDDVMEGLYVRTEADGFVTGRAKLVRPEFVEKLKLSEHWQHKPMTPNRLANGAGIWS